MATTKVSKALLVRLEALPGREDEVRDFLNQGLSIVEGEPKKGLDPGSWTRCHFGYAASVRVADLAAA